MPCSGGAAVSNFESADLDKRYPAELFSVLLKMAEIDPNDMKWQIWMVILPKNRKPKLIV